MAAIGDLNRTLLKYLVVLTFGSTVLLLSSHIIDQPVIVLFLTKLGLVIGGGGTLFIWACRRVLGGRQLDKLLINLLILATTTVILLISAEFVVRFVFRDITTTADNSSYFARRWTRSNVRLNMWGFREREFQFIKPVKLYRIAIIGDSLTFGQGIAENERFTNLLEGSLNRNGREYEVLNFGIPGAETIDHLDILKDVVSRSNPDFVLLQWYINDFEGRDKKGRPKSIPLLPSSTLNYYLHQWSAGYYLVNRQWISLQKALGLSGGYSYAEYMHKRFGDPGGADSQNAMRTLRDFIRLCKERDTPLGIVLFPQLFTLGSEYSFDYMHNQVLEICTREGITCLDLRYAFAGHTEKRKLWVNMFDAHPGPLANRIAAESILEVFGHIGLQGHP